MINIAVVGFGYWGPNLVRNFSETPGANVAAVADFDPQKLETVSKRYPAARTTVDWHELLGDDSIDAIAIATPVASHYSIALAALEAGKHVWLEKPMTETSEQALALIEAAESRGLVLLVDHTFIYTPAVRKMHDIIHSGELGRIFYYDSVRVNLGLFQRDVSVIADLAVHDFSILDYLLHDHPAAVTASGTNHFEGTPANLAYMTMFYDCGTIAHANVSWLAPVKLRQILVGGSKKMIRYDDLEPTEKVKVYDKGISFTDDPGQIHEMRVGYRSGDMLAPKLAVTEALRIEGEHFVECIEHHLRPQTDGHLGLRVVQLIEAACLSMRRRGETVALARPVVPQRRLRSVL